MTENDLVRQEEARSAQERRNNARFWSLSISLRSTIGPDDQQEPDVGGDRDASDGEYVSANQESIYGSNFGQ